MKKKSHIKVIAGAFLNDLPVDEVWYQKRLAACEACEWNTKNYAPLDVSGRIELRASQLLHGFQDSCVKCGCFIRQKCAAREVACSLETEGRAKWHRLEVITSGASDLNLTNLSEEICNINLDENGSGFVVTYIPFRKSEKKELEARFILKTKNGVKIEEVTASCSCFSVRSKTVSESELQLDVVFHVEQLTTGKISKEIFVKYRKKDGSERIVGIRQQLLCEPD
jgi:hypothetical protein